MSDAFHKESVRQARFRQRQLAAMENMSKRSPNGKVNFTARAHPAQDYPHCHARDLFGVGGFGNLPEYHLTYEDLMTELSKASGKERELTCEIMTSLRRRNLKLKDHQLIMGPYNAWTDYFPSFKKKDEHCDP